MYSIMDVDVFVQVPIPQPRVPRAHALFKEAARPSATRIGKP